MSKIARLFPDQAPPDATMPEILSQLCELLNHYPDGVQIHVAPPLSPVAVRRLTKKRGKDYFPIMTATAVLWYEDDRFFEDAEWKALVRVGDVDEAIKWEIIDRHEPVEYISVSNYQITAVATPDSIIKRLKVDL